MTLEAPRGGKGDMLLGSGAVSQQKWRAWWVRGDEESCELVAGTRRRLCLKDVMRGRRWVRILGGEEEEATREVLTHATRLLFP